MEQRIGTNLVYSVSMIIKKLHSNNGGEYADEAFQVYLNREEILWEPTVIHNSQENGIIEYMIQMIIKMIKSMLADSDLSVKIWPELVDTAVYLRIRIPN